MDDGDSDDEDAALIRLMDPWGLCPSVAPCLAITSR